ncbi:hypothetical protein Tco_0843436 [Tanacetum coccineum]|uniref:Retrovirus-related Pol polyprotein from transposon TNT 1-94 n=1 Tax=Tanacetum coccineum TaxID=301880 RepID=A0ABQ5B3U9_9ASTR
MARDSDDALVCCVENTAEDRIMDSGALFHATYCKEELERFKLRSGKVHLADDKTLDIAGIGDVLDKEGYHVGFGYQQWKVTKGSLVVAHGNKRGSLYMVEYTSRGLAQLLMVDIYFYKPGGLGKQRKLSFMMLEKTRKLQSRSCGRYNANLQFGVAERLSQTFRAKSTRIRVEAPKMLWEDSVSMTYLIYCIPYFSIGFRIPEEEWRGKDTSLAHLKMKYDTTFGIRRVTRLSKAEILHLWTQFIEPENDSIVTEHGLSSEITQSPGGSSNTSEGSKNSGIFEDSGRSDEEYSKDGASSKEGGFETPQVRRSNTKSRALVRKEGITKIMDNLGIFQPTLRTVTEAEGTTEGGKQNIKKSKSWKIGEIKYRQSITCWNYNQKRQFHNQCLKLVASRDKEVNMARDSDDALVCCIENTAEDRIMDSGTLFHATYCKEELERFKLRSGKVHLADDKTLDIAGIGDVVLKTSFGTSGLGKQRKLSFMMLEKTRKLQSRSCGRAKSTGIRVEAPKMLWEDSVSTTYLIYRIPYFPIGLRIPKEEWQGKDTSLTHLKERRHDKDYGCSRLKKSRMAGKGSGYQQKGRKPSQNDKTEHGMEITVQNQGQSPKMTKSESILKNQQSNRSRNRRILLDAILTHLMG